MITAFVDMVGLLMVVPLLPYYALEMGGAGIWVGILVSAFSLAQILSAPLWGRVSDHYGRRPALLVSLSAAAVAYVVFAFSQSLWLLLISRLVQGAGGGTVGVIQAYVADATEPKDRAKSLGWLSAATNLGVTIGPVLGAASLVMGRSAPGLLAAGLCVLNIAFAWAFLTETHVGSRRGGAAATATRPRHVIAQVLRNPGEPAPRLIWIYAIGMGAFMGFNSILVLVLADRFAITAENIWMVFTWNGAVAVLTRAFILGHMVDWLGEARLARLGQVLLAVGLMVIPFTARIVGEPIQLPLLANPIEPRILALGLAMMLVPLGTAFTFPCVTALLSKVIDPRERGVVMGVQQSFGGVARILSPLWMGFAFDNLGPGFPFWTCAGLVAATLMLTVGIDPEAHRHPAPLATPGPAAAPAAD